MNLIEKAVRPLKKDAIERAKQTAEQEVEKVRSDLAEAGGDINKAAPYPQRLHGFQHEIARMRYQKFHALVVPHPDHRPSYTRNAPYIVMLDEEKAKRFIQQRMDWAAEEYEAFVAKLVKKIGEVTKAKLIGNHVWSYSTLIVTTPDGEEQAWKTQQIVNYSKLGKPFNQWPTRRMKKVPDMKKAA